jgi:hypothetical protein
MRIGIFGDSHADCNYRKWEHAPDIGKGWPEWLTQFYKIKNFALGGTGLWYSYETFIKCHKKFDVNIFLPSQAHRFSITLPERNETFNIVPTFTNDPLGHKHRRDTPLDNEILNAADAYIKYILNYDREKTLGSCLIDKIVKIRPDTIILNCFDNWDAQPFDPDTNFGLSHMSRLEYDHWNVTPESLRASGRTVDYRKCHISDENNEMVFKKVLHAIQNKLTYVDFSKEDVIKSNKSIDFYFKKYIPGGLGNNV